MPATFRDKITDAAVVLDAAVKSFRKNGGGEKAAAFAYYGFFSMIPLLLLVVYVLGNLMFTSATAVLAVDRIASGIMPEFGNVIFREVFTLSQNKRIWGPFSVIALYWSITPLAGAIKEAFSHIFSVDRKISFFMSKLRDAAAVLAILTIFTALALSESAYASFVRGMGKSSALLLLSANAASFLTAMGLLCMFYFFFIPVRVKFPHIFAGALFSAALWSAMGPVFSLFLRINPDYGITFGSMKAVFILFVWVYYSFNLILFGAEIIANAGKKEAIILKGLFGKKISRKMKGIISGRFTERYSPGEVLFVEGSEGKSMYFIVEGSVKIVRAGVALAEMKKGGYFGEMSLLLDAPRTADAVAGDEGAELAVISGNNFETILAEEPRVMAAVLREMASRLKAANESG